MAYFGCVDPRLDCAPCPPFFLADLYTVFIEVARQADLTEYEIEIIRARCDIHIPTTTTTTTTSTSTTPTTTTTTTRETTTAVEQSTTTSKDLLITNATGKQKTGPPSTSASADSNRTTHGYNTSSSYTNFTDSFVTTTLLPDNATTLNDTVLTGETKGASSIPCDDICVIAVATSAVCFVLILLSVAAVLLRRGREESKRKRSRSRSRGRFGDMPNTQLYDSIDVDLQDTSSYRNSVHSTTSLRHSADMSTFAPFFDNPGYRRSFELRNSVYGSWYDPEASNYEYSQTMANLTRKSRSPDRSPGVAPAHDRRSSERGTHATSARSNHVNMREYVPKIIQNGDTPFSNNMPYSAPNVPKVRNNSTGHSPERVRRLPERGPGLHERARSLQDHSRGLHDRVRNTSPSRRTLPRTPIDTRKGPPDYEEVQRQRAAIKGFKRSKSYDPKVSIEYNSGNDGGYWTIETCKNARKHYIKNSQKEKGHGQNRRDQSTKSKLQRQQDEPIYTLGGANRQAYELQMKDNVRPGYSDQAILSSNLQPDYRTAPTRSRNRSRKRERTRSENGIRPEKVPSYRQIREEPVCVYQTRL